MNGLTIEILDIFEDLLEKYGITICAPEDLEDFRKTQPNPARIYGTEWEILYDRILDAIIADNLNPAD